MNKTIKILLIEDDLIILNILENSLQRFGYMVSSYSNSRKVLDAKLDDFHMVITDCGLPDICGFELASFIRKQESMNNEKPKPIIMLSGYTYTCEMKRLCESSGVDEFITKPILADDLNIKIQYWLKKYSFI